MSLDNNSKVFFELLRAGLWEKEARLSQYKDIDFSNMTDKECRMLINDIIRTGIDEKSLDDSKALLFRIDTDYWTDDEVIEKIKIFGRL